ncbi:hypothetical protein [Candidatus Methylacidithermus pantelleriae]|uniref:Uncharacterized protein n=1 Tax=Candidatus Methylacidithermus pantelleriae TaxID=2744239 RepID=A0A8J2BMS7_9BACT|nr:hypothetical protein [Candidatus Methylacidithermus pantelleriae]CAF0697091.1 hypothetical protein MPNT_200054 [Candidatus Methylacidithermus pantelleriae]
MGNERRFPFPADRLPIGTVIVHAGPERADGVVLYARLFSDAQKLHPDTQPACLTRVYAKANGCGSPKVVSLRPDWNERPPERSHQRAA